MLTLLKPRKVGWVLAIQIFDGTDENGGGDQWHWEYWTGEMSAAGNPSRTPWRGGAFHFDEAAKASRHINWQPRFYSAEWRVLESKPTEDR